MIDYMINFFISGFIYPGIFWHQVLIGIGLGIIFGAVWYSTYWTSILGKPWAWAVLIISIILSWSAIAFIQIPLQVWTGKALSYFWSQEVLLRWLLLAGLPQILYSGLVQEGSKLVPVVIYWWKKGKNIDPKLGLVIGAVAGLGLGVFEAVWVHNSLFISGWSWDTFRTTGLFVALLPFWERFFVVAFHTASSALAGWGLAKGWGWQFYLIASFTHTAINYSAVILQKGILDHTQLAIYIAVCAMIVTAIALLLRYRKSSQLVLLRSQGN
jgi:RsiW-degrading membrane proteinase PrsW (M82 family)